MQLVMMTMMVVATTSSREGNETADGHPPPVLPPSPPTTPAQGVGNNLNQLARLPLPRDLALAVETLLGEVHRVRDEVLSALEAP